MNADLIKRFGMPKTLPTKHGPKPLRPWFKNARAKGKEGGSRRFRLHTLYQLGIGDVAMTTTLDGQALTVSKWGEDVKVQASQWDAWVSSGGTSAYKRKVKVYGIVRTYIIECIEQNVAWASSKANYFEQTAQNGNSVVLYTDQAVRPANNVNVYVLSVSWTEANIGNQNMRNFTLFSKKHSLVHHVRILGAHTRFSKPFGYRLAYPTLERHGRRVRNAGLEKLLGFIKICGFLVFYCNRRSTSFGRILDIPDDFIALFPEFQASQVCR